MPAYDERAATALSRPLLEMDTAKVAGLLVIGAVGLLAMLRSSFGGVQVKLGD